MPEKFFRCLQSLALLVAGVGSASCGELLRDSAAAASTAEQLAAACTGLRTQYIPPRGDGHGTPQKTDVLLRQLGLPGAAGRTNAARRILEHSECYAPGILLGAIAVTSAAGDPRTLTDLEEIATGVGYEGRCRISLDEEDPGSQEDTEGHEDGEGRDQGNAHRGNQPRAVEIRYSTLARIAAAAAIGRVIERPRTPGGAEGSPVEPERVEDARLALSMIAGCADEPSDLRAAATESLGILREPAAQPLLELLAADPDDPNTTTAAILRLSAERSLTTTLVNNHSANSPTADELADLLRASREGGAQ